mmetsp:Transcript_25557/g.44599  ORF Transcript_25557/g.44599 Transcript_25557/m.44599 type:complete len:133 (+) Transcript_25557:77-475(+)
MDPRSQLNISLMGHIDSGKTTLAGHLAYLFEIECEESKPFYERFEAANIQPTFKFAWVLSGRMIQQRERGITIEPKLLYFDSPDCKFTLTDCPGHRDFTKNMIRGTTQADVGILVVSANFGEFEAGIRNDFI